MTAAAQEGSSKAPVAAYDGRLWVRERRSGGQCCLDVRRCVSERETILGGRSRPASCGALGAPLWKVRKKPAEVTAVEVLPWYLTLKREKGNPQS